MDESHENAQSLRLLIAVVLAAAAWLSWSESRLAARVADAKQDIATLNHDNLDALTPARALSDYLPGDRRRLSDDIRIAKATVAYWLGRYGAVAADTDSGQADADILLAAANAAFREAQRDPGTGPAAVQRLDGVLQAYASALKAAAWRAELGEGGRRGLQLRVRRAHSRPGCAIAARQGRQDRTDDAGQADVRRRSAAGRDRSTARLARRHPTRRWKSCR